MLFVPLLLFAVGFAQDEREAPARRRSVSTTEEIHYIQGCEMGFGFDPWKRVCMPSAFLLPPYCSEINGRSNGNCISQTVGELGWTVYQKKTTSAHDYNELMNTMVQAEGGGWGVNVATSVSHMSQKARSSRSIGFWIGANGDRRRYVFRNPGVLKLNSAAKRWLKKDPARFLKMYGTHYVHEITESSSFLGEVLFSSRSSAWKKKLSVMVQVSFNALFFSGSAKTQVDKFSKGADSNTKMEISASYKGRYHAFPQKTQGVGALKAAFDSWQRDQRGVKSHAVPTRLQYRPYADLIDVQNAMVDMDEKYVNLFYQSSPSTRLMKIMSQEYFWSNARLETLKWLKTSSCVKKHPKIRANIRKGITDLEAHLLEFEDMTGTDFALRKEELKKKETDWFMGMNTKNDEKVEKEMGGLCVPEKKKTYTYVHEGHCAAGWLPGNTKQASTDACSRQCLSRTGCAYFAYSRSGKGCALYSRCPDDNRYPAYKAYRLALADGARVLRRG